MPLGAHGQARQREHGRPGAHNATIVGRDARARVAARLHVRNDAQDPLGECAASRGPAGPAGLAPTICLTRNSDRARRAQLVPLLLCRAQLLGTEVDLLKIKASAPGKGFRGGVQCRMHLSLVGAGPGWQGQPQKHRRRQPQAGGPPGPVAAPPLPPPAPDAVVPAARPVLLGEEEWGTLSLSAPWGACTGTPLLATRGCGAPPSPDFGAPSSPGPWSYPPAARRLGAFSRLERRLWAPSWPCPLPSPCPPRPMPSPAHGLPLACPTPPAPGLMAGWRRRRRPS